MRWAIAATVVVVLCVAGAYWGWHQYDRYVQRVTEQQQRCALSREAFRLVDRVGLPTDQLREWTPPGCWRMISRDDAPTPVRGPGYRPMIRS